MILCFHIVELYLHYAKLAINAVNSAGGVEEIETVNL